MWARASALATLGIRVSLNPEGGSLIFTPDEWVSPTDRAWLSAHPAEALAAQETLDRYTWSLPRAIILQTLVCLLHQDDMRTAADSAARKLYDELGVARARMAAEEVHRRFSVQS